MKKILIITLAIFLFYGCSKKEPQVLKYEQKTDYLVKEIEPLEVNIENFNSREFMPWSIGSIDISKEKASWANFVYRKKDKYYAENISPWNFEDIKNIIKSTNFKEYNQNVHYAITVTNAQVRNLPTFKPFFIKTTLAGEGYPFDYMQNTRLHVNTPLLISHYSNDGAWAFVQSPVSAGWLPRNSFALLDAKQRSEFKNTKKIVITQDDTPIYTNSQEYLLHVKLGAQFALTKEDDSFFYSYMYTRFGNKIEIRIPKSEANKIPLEFNEKNILHVSSQLLGEKYGWGGFLQNRDCSSMTKDFLTPFGVWLPRNSASQKDSGEYLSLTGWNNKEKEMLIKKYGIAFLSLIYLKGHIMLYAGTIDDKVMVMHNMWGIKTQNDGKEGRYVIGKSVISDLYLGEDLDNVKDEALLIARVEGIVIKPNLPKFAKNRFVNAYPDIIKYTDNILYFEDGNSLEYDDHTKRTFQDKLDNPSIKDTLALRYPSFEEIKPPGLNYDPGRFRNEELLKKLYGKNEKEIRENLVEVQWLDGHKILFNSRQNASIQLKKVIQELKTLPKKYTKYITNIAGTYNYRYIKDTNRLSTHSFGIAIDINVKQSAYWKWDKEYRYKNKIPKEIVDIFEKYGFIWGGRWYHYDTMHFEYRPELFDSID
jgi:hypothetical protein